MNTNGAKIYKANTLLITSDKITAAQVQISVHDGIGIYIVGIPDGAAKELLLYVVTALQAKGKRIPGKKIIIIIDHEKASDGARWSLFDLPVYVALSAIIDGKAPEDLDPKAWYTGQIDLTGNVLPGKPLNSAALRDIIEDGYLVCPLGSFPTTAMISNVNAI